MLNIVIFHHFDYPEGMASTKRFQLFAEHFLKKGCLVTFVLKSHTVNTLHVEEGIHKGIKYYKVFSEYNTKYPFYNDKRQYDKLLVLFQNLFKINCRNIILTEGVTADSIKIIKFLLPKWELYCDYVEDYSTLSSIFSDLWKVDFLRFIKSKIFHLFYKPYLVKADKYMFKNAKGISAISPYLFKKAKKYAVNVIDIPVTANSIKLITKQNFGQPVTLFFAGDRKSVV